MNKILKISTLALVASMAMTGCIKETEPNSVVTAESVAQSATAVQAMVNAIPAVEKLVAETTGDEQTGVRIVLKALEEPVRQIAANAGLEGSVIVDKILSSGKVNYGFDAYNEDYTDMLSAGIVDPTKVTRSALQNAASVASMVLTTESLVTEKKEDAALAAAQAAAAAGAAGGMY